MEKLQSDIERPSLPAEQVANVVEYVNEDIMSPFVFEVGKPTNLALFLTSQSPAHPRLFVRSRHNRSASFPQMTFRSRKGTIYHEVDLKGCGFVHDSLDSVGRISLSGTPGDEYSYGLCYGSAAHHDVAMERELNAAHIRTHTTLAITRIEEIIQDGDILNVKSAQAGGLIAPGEYPVIQIRAFPIKTRIQDLDEGGPEEVRADIDRAKRIVEVEIGRRQMTDTQYLKWFANQLARQIARMHASGYMHGYLTGHNITLDCRIVDLDSVQRIDDCKEADNSSLETDLECGYVSLIRLAHRLDSFRDGNAQLKRKCQKTFFRDYKRELYRFSRKQGKNKL